MNINDILAQDFAGNVLHDFSEWIQYIPYQQPPKKIKALINRSPASAIPGLSDAGVYQHEIMITRSQCDGIMEVNKGKDAIVMNDIYGGDEEKFIVSQILHSDSGVWRLACG
jgi:hypothetical protein